MSATNELRVFISSTFLDLQEEREHLVKKIFPEIRALCRERRITFTEVDLRWGLTEEDVVLGQVIRTCLEEIDKCRPYFIGITGERYGYIPQYIEVQKDPELFDRYPWIEEAVLEESSIIDMEFRHAALNSVGPRRRNSDNDVERTDDEARFGARFFFRRARRGLVEPVPDEEHHRLENLKERVVAAGFATSEFRDPGSLGEMVYDELVEIIRRDFAEATPPTLLEQEQSRHAAFAASRRRAYIANPEYIKRLNDFADADSPPLVIYAESGSGKSSLVSYWCEQRRRRFPDTHIIEHYVGIGAGATDHYATMLHIMEEIKVRFARDEPLPTAPQEIERQFPAWLERTRGGRVIVVIDGINQLLGSALHLGWLPRNIPSVVRLIVTTTVEQTLVDLRSRGWDRLGMQMLRENEREAVVVRFLSEYHKALLSEQVARIASDPKCAHALFLRTLLEELRLVGRHEDLDAALDEFLNTTGTEDLFQQVLERMEEDYSQKSIRNVMTLLWSARSGLSEEELAGLTGISRLKLSTMLLGLDFHLVRRDGLLTFFHDYLRRAIEKRYLSEESSLRAARLRLADYFKRELASTLAEATTGSDRTALRRLGLELAFQYQECEAWEELHDCLASIPVFVSLYDDDTAYEVNAYWSRLGQLFDLESTYLTALEGWEAGDEREECLALTRVSRLLEVTGHTESALAIQRKRLASAERLGDRSEEAQSRERIGGLLRVLGLHREAISELQRARDLHALAGDMPRVAYTVGTIGWVHASLGEYDLALQYYLEQEHVCREVGDPHALSHAIALTGVLLYRRGDYAGALERLLPDIRLSRESGDRQQLAIALSCVALVYQEIDEFDNALNCVRECESIGRSIGYRFIIAGAIGNIGNIYYDLGRYDEAVECHLEYEQISREVNDRLSIGIAVGNRGTAHIIRGDFETGLRLLQQAITEHVAVGVRDTLSEWTQRTAEALLGILDASEVMPEYLPQFVPEATPDAWRAPTIAGARKAAEECVAICEELHLDAALFIGNVLVARVTAEEGGVDEAIDRLRAMLDSTIEDRRRSELHYWIWKLASRKGDHAASEVHRVEALKLYGPLAAKSPRQVYHSRLDELTASAPSL